eukprot:scaffold2163_cov120-Isochrysis_galbana.AAC.1
MSPACVTSTLLSDPQMVPASFDPFQPTPVAVCRLAGRLKQAAAAHCALRWHLRALGFARSRGGAARHLKQSVCCGVDGVVKIKVCRPNGPA